MMTLAEVERLCRLCPESVTLPSERVLALIAVVRAADTMRMNTHFISGGKLHDMSEKYDRARAALAHD